MSFYHRAPFGLYKAAFFSDMLQGYSHHYKISLPEFGSRRGWGGIGFVYTRLRCGYRKWKGKDTGGQRDRINTGSYC